MRVRQTFQFSLWNADVRLKEDNDTFVSCHMFVKRSKVSWNIHYKARYNEAHGFLFYQEGLQFYLEGNASDNCCIKRYRPFLLITFGWDPFHRGIALETLFPYKFAELIIKCREMYTSYHHLHGLNIKSKMSGKFGYLCR